MSVKQFSAVYSLIEDRLIFGFNTAENELYQFFITRAILKLMLSRSEQVIEDSIRLEHNESSSKLISDFQKEGLKKQLNFDDSFDGGAVTPLGNEPILVLDVRLNPENDHVHIALTLASNQVVGFKVTIVQLQALTLLFEKLIHQANWSIINDEGSNNISSANISNASSNILH